MAGAAGGLLLISGAVAEESSSKPDAPATEDVQIIEEVFVTALRRRQALSDVGLSVTAFTGDDLEELGFKEPSDHSCNFRVRRDGCLAAY